jgi:hypothetical protein
MATLKHIDLEVSSTCQASCPMCVRNVAGVQIINPANQTFAAIKKAYKSISKDLVTVTMCGNIGDSMGNKDIGLICRWFIMRNPDILINVHTNGGLGHPSTYKELAMLGVRVIFALDGLEDTNHYHRVGVKWSNVIKNLTAYQSGFGNKSKVRWTRSFNDDDDHGEYGMAEIQMILWRHNQHQLLEMADFAQTYKADLWYRRPVIQQYSEIGNGMPIFKPNGEWSHNLHEPDDMLSKINSYRFSSPHQWFEGNNLRDHVSKAMDDIHTKEGIAIHKWKRILSVQVPVDTTTVTPDIKSWGKDVKPLYMLDNKKTYDVELDDDTIKQYSTPVACKSFNFDEPSDLTNVDADREVFVGADGYVMPCCMMGSAVSMHLQNNLEGDVRQDFINRVLEIGIDKFDTSKHTLEEIIESDVLGDLVYNTIQDNDASKGRLPICSMFCGTHNAHGRPSLDDRDNG